MNNAGTLAGTFLNAFAINEGAIVHVLSGTISMQAGGSLQAIRRSTINDTLAMRIVGTVDPHRRQALKASDTVSLVHAVNISQRHSTRGTAIFRLRGVNNATRRRSAPGNTIIKLSGVSVAHARRVAVGASVLRIGHKRAFATRRQIAIGSDAIRLLHLVNLRAFAPIYGRDRIVFSESAVAVRRVGLPAIGRIALNGIATTTTRRTIRTSSTIALLATIKMPHYRMTPVEEIRAMRLLNELREMSVIPQPSPIIVTPDNRELVVPQRGRMIGTPDVEDPA
ncbi:hypothetical protein ABE527_18530 [Brucella sp. TWI432]